MYTRFGEILRKLRVEKHEVMGDVAKLLGVSTSFLSSVETGKKNVPEAWVDVLSNHYSLNSVERNELLSAINDSKNQVKINLSNSNPFKREMALQFQRSFDEMDEETASRIIDLLNKK